MSFESHRIYMLGFCKANFNKNSWNCSIHKDTDCLIMIFRCVKLRNFSVNKRMHIFFLMSVLFCVLHIRVDTSMLRYFTLNECRYDDVVRPVRWQGATPAIMFHRFPILAKVLQDLVTQLILVTPAPAPFTTLYTGLVVRIRLLRVTVTFLCIKLYLSLSVWLNHMYLTK